MKIAIITINQPSYDSALRLVNYLQQTNHTATIFTNKSVKNIKQNTKIFQKLDDILFDAWKNFDALVFIVAIGAVVRKIAPYLKDKSTDPAVLVVNLDLTKIVPLVGGHIAQANNLANELTQLLPNSVNFISTATDQLNILSFDTFAMKYDFGIKNLDKLANISNRLINQKKVQVATYDSIFKLLQHYENISLIPFDQIDNNSVVISPIIQTNMLLLRPKVFVGIGCNKNTSYELIKKSLDELLEEYHLQYDDIQSFGSFEAKQNEQGLLKLCDILNKPIRFFVKDDINQLQYDFSKSASTKFFGLKGVAEPSAILSSKYKELIIKKRVFYKSITIAIAI